MISAGAAATSWSSELEQYLRMGASLIAIISGCVVVWSVIRNQLKKQK